jgi:hypothetical protein
MIRILNPVEGTNSFLRLKDARFYVAQGRAAAVALPNISEDFRKFRYISSGSLCEPYPGCSGLDREPLVGWLNQILSRRPRSHASAALRK